MSGIKGINAGEKNWHYKHGMTDTRLFKIWEGMSYLLFIICGWALMLFGAKVGADSIDSTTWLCLAILTAGEVISWRCKK